MPELKRLAILDDYQGVTLRLGPWDRLPEGLQIEQFRDTIKDRARAGRPAGALRRHPGDARAHPLPGRPDRAAAEPQAAHHHRRPQPRHRPRGLRGARHHGLRHSSFAHPTVDLTWGLILGARPPHPGAGGGDAGRPLAGGAGHDAGGQDAWLRRARQSRQPGRQGRRRLRDEHRRLEPEPDAGEGRRGRRHAPCPRRNCWPRPTW